MPPTSALASTGCGASGCRREKASSRLVSARARWTPCSAMSLARSIRALAGRVRQMDELAVDGVEPAEHQRQQVVEVVRDAAGELAQRLHLLRLAQLLLEAAPFASRRAR